MDYLAEPQKKIKAALLQGRIMTTAEMNKVGGTVDARKIISRLRHDGLPIGDEWVILFDENGKIIGRYKGYFYTKDGPEARFSGNILESTSILTSPERRAIWTGSHRGRPDKWQAMMRGVRP